MRTAVKILFLLATLFSIASCFPERYQHSNHNGHKDWQSHLLSIILNKTSTGRSSTKLPGSTPLHQGQHTTTSVSPEVTSRNSENSSVQHGYYRGDYYVEYDYTVIIILAITYSCVAGVCLLVGLIICCVRGGKCSKVTRGLVLSRPSVVNQTIVQQQSPGQQTSYQPAPVHNTPIHHGPPLVKHGSQSLYPASQPGHPAPQSVQHPHQPVLDHPPAYELNSIQETTVGIENPGYNVTH